MTRELIDEMISELEAMERLVRRNFPGFVHPLIAKLLAAPVKEPDRSGKWFTVVYKDIKPGDEARALSEHPKMSAMSWSHALHDRDAALAAQRQPMTDAQIDIITEAQWGYATVHAAHRAYARAIEKAHGIGSKA